MTLLPAPLPAPVPQAKIHAPDRQRWKVLAAGTLANAAFAMTFSGIPLTAIALRHDYGLSTSTLGLILGLMGLGIAISELPWGLLTDRWGDRPVLLTGLGGTTLALAALAIWAVPHGGHVPPVALLGALLLLTGLLGGSVNGASGRAIMQWFDAGQRGLAMSIRQTAIPLGGAAGALVLPALAQRQGFTAVFALLAAICAFGLLLCALWIDDPQPIHIKDLSSKTASKNHSALRNHTVWQLCLGIGLLCVPQFAVLQFGSVFLHDIGLLGTAAIAAAMAALQISAMALRIWSGHWTDKRGNRRSYLGACVLISSLLFALLAAASAGHAAGWAQGWVQGWVLALLLALCGTAVSAWHGVAYVELATAAGVQQAGTALGLCNTLVFSANFLTPQAVAGLQQQLPWAAIWLIASGFSLLSWPLLARQSTH